MLIALVKTGALLFLRYNAHIRNERRYMGILDTLFDKIADRLNMSVQSNTQSQRYRDYMAKGESYSIESEISEALADLMLMFSSMPIAGESERARWLDSVADDFFRNKAKTAITEGFISGDCIIIPSWNGRNLQNVIVGADDFQILESSGDEITACAYLVDTAVRDKQTYQLMQAVELVPYTSESGIESYANRYRMFIARNNALTDTPLDSFPQWRSYEREWYIPNVDRLLIGRFKSQTVNTANPNALKGAPICYGASDPMQEIHYLLDQMHEEFGLSEKAIMADKRLFKREWRNGDIETVLPRGRERLFMGIQGNSGDMPIQEWSPDIRYNAYLEAIDKQEKLVERAVGVSSGIISTPNNVNYENVDNVRKSQQRTMSFISTVRRQAESCMLGLVYTWDILANYYQITPIGDYAVNFDWSNEYVETFADRQNAILAGNAIGATDAVDYRMFVMEESPETARERVEEIKAAKSSQTVEVENE